VSKILSILIGILTAAVGAATPALREMVQANVTQWEAAAKKTANPFDDLLVSIVKGIFSL